MWVLTPERERERERKREREREKERERERKRERGSGCYWQHHFPPISMVIRGQQGIAHPILICKEICGVRSVNGQLAG